MLRKNKNIVIAGRATAKPDAAGETAETAQNGARNHHTVEKQAEAVVRKVRSIDIRSKANRIRGGQWRDIW